MNPSPDGLRKRILIIDDNPAIHEDFRKILLAGQRHDTATDDLLSAVLGKGVRSAAPVAFELESAHQGQEGLAKVEAALAEGRPYALAFVDVRMPPGWDGLETIMHLWSVNPGLQVIICTAYSDYSWQDIVEKLGHTDRLVILKKPFDTIEVLQLAHAMTAKWQVTRESAARFADLERSRNALRLSEERLASAFDACPLPTAILRVFDQSVLQANPALLAATGRTAEEIVGQSFWEAGIETSEDFLRTTGERLFRGETLLRHECEFHPKSGERRNGLLWLEPFALAAGPHVLAVLQDVSEQTSLENQLRQAQKMEAVGHLAAGVAHDFNNLLTVIQCHTSLRLEAGNLEPKVADSLAAVQQASQSAAQLTRQLLIFSRKHVMEKTCLSLGDVVSEVMVMLTRLIPESVEIHAASAPGLPPILGDRCNLEQVLVNLVVNARDAMPAGGKIFISTELVEITAEHVRRFPEARVGRFLCLSVRDTGTGMDEKTARRIFEPFFTTKEPGKGTGMGLATVHGIVKQHDGWLELVSVLGEGTSFRIFLPETDAVAASAPVSSAVSKASARGRTVLVAEDNKSVRSLVCRVLKECGLHVFEAADGREALTLWQEHHDEIDLLLTDMIMPGGLSGGDVADHITSERPGLPVIYSSGYSAELFGDRKIQEDINYLPKPYLAHQLAAIVTRTLGDDGGENPVALAVA